MYLNAIAGKGVHVVTVNDYLASYQSELMGRIYRALGMTTGTIVAGQTPEVRREQYNADITYGTNNEFGFDYLRDNMAWRKEDLVQRGHFYAIVDEVDSILIDEARTPLIISGPSSGEANRWFVEFAKIAKTLDAGVDYEVDEKKRTIGVLEPGIEKVEDYLGIDNLYESANTPLISFLNNSIKALALFKRDTDYVVMNDEVMIVDEHTGRILVGRRYNEGIHQAIEAKEAVPVKAENQTLATVTLQNYFRLYDKLAGMTGTAETEAAEFMSTYQLGVVPDPDEQADDPQGPVRPRLQERDRPSSRRSSKTSRAATRPASRCSSAPSSVEKSEYLSRLLAKKGIKHEVLNAKNHAREAEIVARAGRLGAVTVATNMAGRGTDIMLGGNAEFLAVQELKAKGLDPVETPEEYEAAWDAVYEAHARPSSPTRRPRSSRPAACTCSAPSATSRAASTTSCAVARAVRATPARAGSTCRSPTTSCACSSRAPPRRSSRARTSPTTSRSSRAWSRARSRARSRRSRRATPRSARTSSSTTTSSTGSARRSTPTAATSCRATTSPTACSTSSKTRSTPSSTTTPAAGHTESWDFDALWTELKTLYPVGVTIDEVVAEAGTKGRITPAGLKREILSDAMIAYGKREETLGDRRDARARAPRRAAGARPPLARPPLRDGLPQGRHRPARHGPARPADRVPARGLPDVPGDDGADQGGVGRLPLQPRGRGPPRRGRRERRRRRSRPRASVPRPSRGSACSTPRPTTPARSRCATTAARCSRRRRSRLRQAAAAAAAAPGRPPQQAPAAEAPRGAFGQRTDAAAAAPRSSPAEPRPAPRRREEEEVTSTPRRTRRAPPLDRSAVPSARRWSSIADADILIR